MGTPAPPATPPPLLSVPEAKVSAGWGFHPRPTLCSCSSTVCTIRLPRGLTVTLNILTAAPLTASGQERDQRHGQLRGARRAGCFQTGLTQAITLNFVRAFRGTVAPLSMCSTSRCRYRLGTFLVEGGGERGAKRTWTRL